MVEPVEPADADGFVVRRVDSGAEVLLQLIGELDVAGIDRLRRSRSRICQRTVMSRSICRSWRSWIRRASGVLMSLDLRSRAEQWTLTLHAPQPQVLNLLKLCGFEQSFRDHASEQQR